MAYGFDQLCAGLSFGNEEAIHAMNSRFTNHYCLNSDCCVLSRMHTDRCESCRKVSLLVMENIYIDIMFYNIKL